MIFGSVVCDRCGNKTAVDKTEFSNKRLICLSCAKLTTSYYNNGISCGECRLFDVTTHTCSVEGTDRTAGSKCCSTAAKRAGVGSRD